MDLNRSTATFYPTGTVIYVDDYIPNNLYLIKKGEVKILHREKNRLYVLRICKEGEILNEVDVMRLQKSKTIAVAKTDCEIVEVSARDIKHIMDKSPKWINELFNTLCERLSDSEEIVSQNSLTIGTRDKLLIISKDEEKKLLEKIEEFKN